MMTPDEVRRRVEVIRGTASDDELAHEREDDLYRDLLSAIAAGECAEPQECARIALETRDIDFSRDYSFAFSRDY